MRLNIASTLLGIVSFLSIASEVTADLTYYIYAEEEVQYNQEETYVISLRSIGSLPLDKSTFTRAGDACPEVVWEAGGFNRNFLCAGSSHPFSPSQRFKSDSATNVNSNAVFFPIAPSNPSSNILPVRFSAFERSRGTPTGLLTWRNSLAIEWNVAINEDQPQLLDAVSMGRDTSNNNFNSKLLAAHEDGEVLGEWYLLNRQGGQPILEGGKIQFIKGMPPSTSQDVSQSDEINATAHNGAALATANDAPVAATEAPELEHPIVNTCESITDVICSDEENYRYSTLCSLAIQSGLDEMLSLSNGNMFTLYAPTDDGFARSFLDRSAALLSGYDLTKLILNHLVVSEMEETEQMEVIGATRPKDALKYEDMVCGTKIEMASGQIVKIGCDENSEVAYVVGSGNGGIETPHPKFLQVDRQTCNGLIHTVDFVVLPTSDDQVSSTNVHQGAADISVNTSNEDSNEAISEVAAPAIPQIPATVDGKTNQLDKSQIISFFAPTKQDLLEESGIPPTTTNIPDSVETIPAVVETSPVMDARVEQPEQKTLAIKPISTTTELAKPERKEKRFIDTQYDLDTRNNGFYSFFSPNRPFRGGNLRHRWKTTRIWKRKKRKRNLILFPIQTRV